MMDSQTRITNPKLKWHILPSVRTSLGPYRWCPPPPRQLVPSPTSPPQPTREKIESRMRWRRPDLKHTWLKEIEGAPGTCLYVPKSLLFYEILPIGGSCLRLRRKNVAINKVSPTIHGQLSWSSSPQIRSTSNKCMSRQANPWDLFLSCSGGDVMYEIV